MSTNTLTPEQIKEAYEAVKTALAKIYGLPEDAIQLEFFDFLKIISIGAEKYEMNQWLRSDGKTLPEKICHDSMFHHLAESYVGGQDIVAAIRDGDVSTEALRVSIFDQESGLDPLLHLACRALMLYTRRQRGIIHDNDK